MATQASTQHYLNVADIRDDVVILRNGELRQVLEVTALNFALKSEQEQAAIIYQYQAFLNSLPHPVQLLVQSRRLDLTTYLNELRGKMQQSTSELMRVQTADYLDFISRLISLGNIMEKHFYVIIPYANPSIRSRNLFSSLLRKETIDLDEKSFASAKTHLAERTESVRAGLSSIGLNVIQLTSDQLTELLYSTYNPEEAGEITPNLTPDETKGT